MATFKIENKQIASQYEYADDNLKITGNIFQDEKTGDLQKYDGSVFTADGSTYIGTINVEKKDGEMIYSIPPTTKEHTTQIWAAINEIEKNLNSDNDED